eukprot:Gregarina_sp_Poly_1__3725@NODE_20_length_21312_cov_69_583714_g18_i0_p7_GENE_NODE_20_length_21312_cov_69_583714_g18_i0NODE_20_length_21312_cov_69_583714_g18_i0_p7_ORF_typecomplete_len357_score44_95DMT_YdcZ/PF04657_13/3_9e12DMT_YdcZ/PF04657_13/2_4e21_NODE_20_length_21312_cov_69_583714_g18_i01994921019
MDADEEFQPGEEISETRPKKHILKSLSFVLPLAAGCVNPIMGGMNHMAAEVTGNIFFVVATTSTIGYIVATIWNWFTSTCTMKHNWNSVGDFVFDKPVRWIVLCGGLFGGSQSILLTLISAMGGASVFSLGQVLGSVCTSIVLDTTGIFWVTKSKTGLLAFAGAFAVAGGAIVHSLSEILGDDGASPGKQIGLIFASASAGMCTCLQACCTGRLARLTGELRRATAWSLFSGAAALWVIAPYVTRPRLGEYYHPRNWWKMSQFIFVAYTITAMALSQKLMPAAMVYCWYVVGQLLVSTLIDAFGWFNLEQRPIDKFNYIGLAIIVVGVICITASKARRKKMDPVIHEKSSATSVVV